ncbi:hypothetical protein RUM44_004333 [Polyplax serrata]|uniref:Uncharacterized protein n=1 Tax=Polyplax serrata TaxID=468196 RepID=A0ABR1B2I5_POLSC
MKAIEKNQREGGGGGGGGDEKPSFLKFSWKAGDSRTSRNSSGVQVKPAKSLSHRYPDDDNREGRGGKTVSSLVFLSETSLGVFHSRSLHHLNKLIDLDLSDESGVFSCFDEDDDGDANGSGRRSTRRGDLGRKRWEDFQERSCINRRMI